MSIENFLSTWHKVAISDIFLTAEAKPVLRQAGQIFSPPEAEIFSDQAIAEFRNQVLSAEQQQEYHRRGSYDTALLLSSGQRFRLNFLSTASGDAVAARPIHPAEQLDLTALGLPEVLSNWVNMPRGLILICGATGSGKSTTLAALVNYLNQHRQLHILTVEDPIEFVYHSAQSLVTQREVGTHTLDFATAIRDAMRENPDVIVIGEMRDRETMQAAINAALTGHLVISTLHTADTMLAIERIVNMFPGEMREQLALDFGNALLGAAAQRLITTVKGQTQIPAVEVLSATPLVRKLIGERNFPELEKLLKASTSPGMVNFTRAVFQLYQYRKISYEQAVNQVSNREEFNLICRGLENGVDAFRQFYGAKAAPEDDLIDISTLLYSAVRQNASDLLLTAHTSPCVRINGVIQQLDLPPLTPEDLTRLLFGLLTPHQRIAFEEQRELDFALSATLQGKHSPQPINQRFRINAFYQRGSIGLAARVINAAVPPPEELHLPPILSQLITKQQGLILIAGPTGSGKSTTLASLIDQINHTSKCHIITIEDPIEYVHDNINSIIEQREIHADTHDFAAALKHALRQDPDVIMVGEMRDVATMSAALTAAETGHLVLATIHTNSTMQTIDRIVDSFPNHQQNQIKLQLAGVILGIVSQRLLPKRDHSGRVPAFEIMIGTPPVKALIREGKTHLLNSALETGFKDGMITMERALEELFTSGEVAVDELESLKNEIIISQ